MHNKSPKEYIDNLLLENNAIVTVTDYWKLDIEVYVWSDSFIPIFYFLLLSNERM